MARDKLPELILMALEGKCFLFDSCQIRIELTELLETEHLPPKEEIKAGCHLIKHCKSQDYLHCKTFIEYLKLN